MALDNPENEVSPLWKVAIYDGKYCECPYIQSSREGQCWYFRKYGIAACYRCGFERGLDAGYDYGYEDGRNEPNFDDEIAYEEERNAGMD